MRRFVFLSALAGFQALVLILAEPLLAAAPGLDPQTMQQDREFLKSQANESSPIPGLEDRAPSAVHQSAPPPIAESPQPPAPRAESVPPKPPRKEATVAARPKPVPTARAEHPAPPKESKVARATPQPQAAPAPAPAPAPNMVVRNRVVRAVPVDPDKAWRPDGGVRPPSSVERRDDDDAEEAAESEAFRRTVRGFFHRVRGH